MTRRAPLVVGFALAAVGVAGDRAAAHVGGLSGTTDPGSIPLWLTVGTAAAVVTISFLFASLVTDHEAMQLINGLSASVPVPAPVRASVRRIAGAAGVVVLALVVASGLAGPRSPTANLAILVVWSGWWAGYAMSVYLLGNTWPALNPWQSLAARLPRVGGRPYPERLGAWPAVVGLLGLVLIEVISPLAADPGLLAGLVLAYTAGTLAGASVYGVDAWFDRVDPVARVFRCYGRIAPVQRTADGVALRLPTAPLADRPVPERPGETAFVVALLWATTYDGLVTTPAWAAATRAVVGSGVPAPLVYLLAMAGGFLLFLRAYRLAARATRRTADTYVATGFLERWFAPSLLPIAAGYHLAHYSSYFLTLLPALWAAITHPLSLGGPQSPVVLVLPAWFGVLQLGFVVVVGHVLAVWVAHSLAFDLFPGNLRPIRSQYPLIVVMVLYTVTSTWIVAQPFTPPPYT